MDSMPEDPRSPRQTAQRPNAARPDAPKPNAIGLEAVNAETAAQQVLTRRRNLLKAAASVAPVLATLPNGAALANASAFQCANEQLGEATAGRPDGDIAGTLPGSPSPGVGNDQYYRVAGKRWSEFVFPTGNITLYNFTAFNGDPVTVDINGNRFTSTPPANAVNVQLLVLYEPILEDGLVVDLPANGDGQPVSGTDSAGCVIDGTIPRSGWSSQPSAPSYCIYPIAQLGPQSNSINIGMTASCLTSFANPTP